MANSDLSSQGGRQSIIEAIKSEDNIERKREAQREFDCYRHRQDRYIQEKLRQEFDEDSVRDMRQINSINLTKRIVDAESSVYDKAPERIFNEASERELEQIENLYHFSMVNSKMKVSNKYYNLQDQGCLYVIPMGGKVAVRPLALQNYDVIPDSENPEKAAAYILNVWDLDHRNAYQNYNATAEQRDYIDPGRMGLPIADDTDREENKRMVVWTDEVTYTMDGKGRIVSEVVENPIKRLPFIDIAIEKDSQFFVRRGSSTAQFAIDMGVILSDIATTNRNQSFGQGVVMSETQPKAVKTNHNKWLWLPLNKDRPEMKPSLEFVNPNADIQGGLDMVKVLINMFLSSKGLDSSVISGDSQINSASSGIEFLLRMIDKFQASQDDFDLYKWVEWELFTLMRDWSNVSQDFSDGPLALDEDLKKARISEDVDFAVNFTGPQSIKSDKEKIDEVERKLDLGLISQKMAIMEIHGVDEAGADELMEKIALEQRIELGQGREDQDNEIGVESDN